MKLKPSQAIPLRVAAEEKLAQIPAPPVTDYSGETLLHELQVYQVELEMQNEALRQAHVELEESRDHYVDLYEFAPVGYLTLSRIGLIEQVNLTGAALLGEDRKRLLGRRFAHFIQSEDCGRWERLFLTAMQQGQSSNCELALLRADASSLEVRLDWRYLAQVGKEPMLRISLADVSERKHAEEELRIAAIAFESRNAMLVTNARGVIMRVNQAFTRLTGFSAGDVLGKTPAVFHSGRQEPPFYQALWAILEREKSWQGEIWNQRMNGKIVADWLNISAVTAPDGRVTHYVGSYSQITQNSEAEAEIHRLAYYDPLTHLPNRRLLMDRLAQALTCSQRSGRYGALLFLDLDNFKTLNDTRGHVVGDLLLAEVAKRLLLSVREADTISRLGDIISRLGGDEFVVVLEELSNDVADAAAQSRQVGEKLRAALSSPYELQGRPFHCTTSLGITLFRGHGESIESLLKQADLALYHAKGAGRNCLHFFDPAMQAALDEYSALESDLRLAIAAVPSQLQFLLYYQAQLDNERRIFGAEALLRWLHPQRGLIAPGVFIPLAEENGLILPIGRWVLETACAQLKAWQAEPATRNLTLAVNVSSNQFCQPRFVAEVAALLSESGIDPSRLKIEMTESVVIDNVTDSIDRMQALKALGVGFSMDDFGTGFSSLAYLKRLPLDQLKIDQSFVQDLATDPNDAAIVKTIITMGQTLGLNVIAEGVETEAQLEALERYGCTAYQGYLFSRPVPVEEFELYLRGDTS